MHRFSKMIMVALLAAFVTLGTADAWDDTPQHDPPPHKKTAAKAEVKKHDAGEEQAHGGAQAKETHGAAVGHEVIIVEADEALKRLTEGNRQYVSGKFSTLHATGARRAEVAQAQHPFAIILSCSDSRVPPEVLFNQGIGDIFVIRTAGNVSDDVVMGSIEYAVEHLGVRLIMVLGHERCGAVTAAVQGGEAPGHIGTIVEAIKPAVEKAKEKHGDLLDNAIRANAKMVAQNLSASKPILAELFGDGVLKIVGAYYDLDSGTVTVTYNPK